MKIKKGRKNEDGQAMVEFVLVFPVFFLLICMILDFGWLFYNYIGVENSSRNAARIACVEYTDCCYDEATNSPKTSNEFNLSDSDYDNYTDEEKDIVDQVKNTLPSTISKDSVKINIVYSYDNKTFSGANVYDVNDRYTGDVTVYVTCDIKVLTPILGVFSNDMKKTVTTTSTFKVEQQNSSE